MYTIALYKQILECAQYETRNPSVYGDVIFSEMEFTPSRKKLQLELQGDEDNL